MDLRTYLIEFKITQEEFARKTGLTLTTISKLCSGRGSANLDSAITIVKTTKGLVGYEELAVKREKKARRPQMKKLGEAKRLRRIRDPKLVLGPVL